MKKLALILCLIPLMSQAYEKEYTNALMDYFLTAYICEPHVGNSDLILARMEINPKRNQWAVLIQQAEDSGLREKFTKRFPTDTKGICQDLLIQNQLELRSWRP